SQDSRCLFGYGESDSDHRAHEALALALKNPLMDRGKMLTDARHVLVQISGGPGMTLTEVEIVMQELNRHVEDHTQILFGTSVDGKMGNRMSVTLISSLSADGIVPAAAPMRTIKKSEQKTAPTVVENEPAFAAEPTFAAEPEEVPLATEYAVPAAAPLEENFFPEREAEPLAEEASEAKEEEEAPKAQIPPPSPVRRLRKPVPNTVPEPETASAPVKKDKFAHARQEVMQFEPVTRGRFEKSEPTIVEGQDLDVPTFLRKNVRVR
nr:hypothetical protein [Chthoniobacterales bacterium]